MSTQIICSIEGCESNSRARTWCWGHYNRWQRYGDPMGGTGVRGKRINPRTWRAGDSIGYSGAHERVKSMRGSAVNQDCVDCSAPATDWSYNGSAPNEIQGMTRSDQWGVFASWSADPNYYVPRCKSCHVKFDHLQKTAV